MITRTKKRPAVQDTASFWLKHSARLPCVGRPSLVELLDLTALIAQKEPGRHARVAARWLFKYLEAKDDATIDDAALAAAYLSALGGRRQVEALATVRAMAEEASSGSARRGVA